MADLLEFSCQQENRPLELHRRFNRQSFNLTRR